MFLEGNGSVDAEELLRELAEKLTNRSGARRRMSLLKNR
jgi:hypothetical protein